MANAKPVIAIIALGGTIAMTSPKGQGATVTLGAEDLVSALPQLIQLADIRAHTLLNRPSPSLTWDDLRLCRTAIMQAIDDGAEGVVVLQGTDTMEESAFFLDLVCDVEQPIVMTGAMRHGEQPGSDGPANILAAVQTALDPQARDIGVLVVMNDYIHSARYVTKTHTSSVHAFESNLCGPVGIIAEGMSLFCYHPVMKTLTFNLPDTPAPKVGIFRFAFGQSWSFDAMLNYDAVVIGAAGGGHVAADDVAPFREIAAKLPVVLASRTGNGLVMTKSYSYPGSESELIAAGLIPAGTLNTPKARIVATLALWNGQQLTDQTFAF